MKRQIIKIDEGLCNGCGQCITGCPEGALQLIDGKARLVSDLHCDGLGACIGTCPMGAITIEERDADPYDEHKVMEEMVGKGSAVIASHLAHLKEHGEETYLREAIAFLQEKGFSVPVPVHQEHVCPGSAARTIDRHRHNAAGDDAGTVESQLNQWPVQLALLNPSAPYFDDADLLIAADCVPFAFGDFHRRFLKGKTIAMFCPKLDNYIDEYIEKLASVFTLHKIRSVTTVRMEVPCCGGINMVLQKALEKSHAAPEMREYIVSIDGEVIDENGFPAACAL